MALRNHFSNILILKPGAIGDLLQMTPVIRSLNTACPDARITVLVGSRLTADLFRYNSRVREIVVYDRHREHRSFRALLALRQELKRRRFDLVINFQRSNMRTWFLASAAFPCTVLVYHKARKRNIHAVVNYLETLAPLGIRVDDTRLELTPGADDRDYAERILREMQGNGPVIALNPGASHAVNRWPSEKFADLADMLSSRLSARVLVIGGPDDVLLADAILARNRSKPLSIAGKANLLQLAAVMERTELVISGDTGPLHLATAVGTRTVALFGAADPVRTGPVGQGHVIVRATVPCVPCRSRVCKNSTPLECMNAITVEQVFAAVKMTLQDNP